MFGCLIADQTKLSDAEKARYKGCYCGLCKVLKERHGLFGRVALTYDMTFLVLLLTSMLEPEEKSGMERCMAHPARKHYYWLSALTEYAADMNVALAYHNCRDDFLDDGSAVGFWESEALREAYGVVRGLYPRQCDTMERELTALAALERENRQEPDAANLPPAHRAENGVLFQFKAFLCQNAAEKPDAVSRLLPDADRGSIGDGKRGNAQADRHYEQTA